MIKRGLKLTHCHIDVNFKYMQLVRTTLRLDKFLKKEAERIALEEDITLQNVINQALAAFLQDKAHKFASKKIKLPTLDLGYPLDNLTRANFYEDPTKNYRR